MGEFVKANQIISLDAVRRRLRLEGPLPDVGAGTSPPTRPTGRDLGSGNLYGLPQMGEIVGVYYDEKKLADLGLKVPTTWSEFRGAARDHQEERRDSAHAR